MPADQSKSSDYQPLRSSAEKSGGRPDTGTSDLRPAPKNGADRPADRGLSRPADKKPRRPLPSETVSGFPRTFSDGISAVAGKTDDNAAKPASGPPSPSSPEDDTGSPFAEEPGYAEEQKKRKREKQARRDWELLGRDNWLARNGHYLTYIALYLFSVLVLFRPYELAESLQFLSSKAFYLAALTLALYFPAQIFAEGNLTKLSTEVKAVLGMVLVALLTMPIAKDIGMAWEAFNDIFIKAVAMFVVMVNVLRTRRRLLGMMWLSLAVAVYLSYTALDMYSRGELTIEGYRVAVDVGGMFGNPNDLAMHLVMMMPLAVTLGIAARKKWLKIVYFLMAGMFVAAVTVTYSRGGFLGLIAVTAILVWKLGRQNRLKISVIALLGGLLFIFLAPGNYGERMLSIFNPSLDAVGSGSQRRELLNRSIIVTLRNPWGIGIGNFPIVGVRNLGTHNSYTQVSAELGLLGLTFYLTFILSPLRKLFAMQRRIYEENRHDWFYYLAIGFQASIAGFMVTSFFAAVAYNWFIYYLIAYAVGFRRIYQIGLQNGSETVEKTEDNQNPTSDLPKA